MESLSKKILYNFPLLLLAFLTIFTLFRFIFIFFFKAAFEPEFIFQLTPLHIISSMGYEPKLFLSLVVVVLNTYLHLNATIKNIKYSFPLTLCMVGGIGLGFLTKEATIEFVPNIIIFGLFLFSIILDHKRTLDYPESLKAAPANLPAQPIATSGRPKPRMSVAGASTFFARLPRLKINRGGAPKTSNVKIRRLGILRRPPKRAPGQPGYPQGSPPQTYRPRARPPGSRRQPQTGNARITYSDGGGGRSHAIPQGSAREGAIPIGVGSGDGSGVANIASSWDRERPSEPTRTVRATPGAKEGSVYGKDTRYIEKKVYIEGPSGIEERTVRIPAAPDVIPQPIKGGDNMVKMSEEIIDADGEKMIITKELPGQATTTIPIQITGESVKEEKSSQTDITKKEQIVIPEVTSYFEKVQNGLEALANTIETLFKKIQFPGQNFVTTQETTPNKNWFKKETIGESVPSFVGTSFSMSGERPENLVTNYPSYDLNLKRRNRIRRAQNILKKLEYKVDNLERLYHIK
jgi:hypothetical protein